MTRSMVWAMGALTSAAKLPFAMAGAEMANLLALAA
jgi:hypothetical protein